MAIRVPQAAVVGGLSPNAPASDTTAALEAITDPGLFERVAVAALRIHRPHYTLSTLGVNSDHKTVKAAVDAFGTDRSDGDYHVVFAAHATSPRDQLQRKWLYDKTVESARRRRRAAGEDGDVIKAARVAASIRAQRPDAKVTLVLTTNRVPALELLQMVSAAAGRYHLDIEVFDRSAIAHVLEFTADGTAVRRQLLGIDTDRVSRDLLAEIGRRSAAEYAKWHQDLRPDEWEDRATPLLNVALASEVRLVALMGQSGYGKSALSLQLLRSYLDTGGIALWARAEIVERASSLQRLLEIALQEWHPTIEPDAARRALLVADPARPIVIVVDDVMRVPRPQQALATLYAWSQPPAGPSASSGSSINTARLVLVAPVWPTVWESLGANRVNAKWLRVIGVGALDEQKTTQIVRAALESRGVAISESESVAIARRLGGDPFLVSLLIGTAADVGTHADALFVLAGDVLAQYVETMIAKLAGPGGEGTLTVATYRSALERLCRSMLATRALEPPMSRARQWWADDEEGWCAVTELLRQGRLLFEDKSSGEPVLRFRHDRLRDAALTVAMRSVLETKPLDLELAADPLFAGITGAALVRVPITRAGLEAVAARTPAALAESLRAAGSRTFANRDLLVDVLGKWIERVGGADLGSARTEAALQAVAASTAPEVVRILAPLPRTPGIALTRLAHGSIADGLWVAAGFTFSPEVSDTFRDRSIDLLLHRHRTRALSELTASLTDQQCGERVALGGVRLAGFIGDSRLASVVDDAWRRITDPVLAVVAGLWAMTQCASENELPRHLDPLIEAWAALPDDNQTLLGSSSRGRVSDEFVGMISRVGVRDAVVRYLGQKMEDRPTLRSALANALRNIDSPEALRILLPYAASIRHRLKPGQFSPWLSTFASDWRGDVGRRRVWSTSSRHYLRGRWLSESEEVGIRHEALRLWVVTARVDELPALQAIEPESPLFDTALWTRGLLGDQTALEPILRKVDLDPWWYRVAAPLWGPEIRASIERDLGSWSALAVDASAEERINAKQRDDAIRWLLTRIPAGEATAVLVPRWVNLRDDVEFVMLALSLGTLEADRLVAEAADAGMPPEEFVRYIGIHLGIGSEEEARITAHNLRSIEPYVGALGDHELRDFAGWCERFAREWGATHIVPRLSDEIRRQHFPTDDDLDYLWNARANNTAPHWQLLFQHWIETLVSDPATRSRIVPLVIRRLAADAANFLGAAIALRVVGSRADIALLEPYGKDPVARAVIDDVRYAVMERTGEGFAAD